jgi:hypothetical protein
MEFTLIEMKLLLIISNSRISKNKFTTIDWALGTPTSIVVGLSAPSH